MSQPKEVHLATVLASNKIVAVSGAQFTDDLTFALYELALKPVYSVDPRATPSYHIEVTSKVGDGHNWIQKNMLRKLTALLPGLMVRPQAHLSGQFTILGYSAEIGGIAKAIAGEKGLFFNPQDQRLFQLAAACVHSRSKANPTEPPVPTVPFTDPLKWKEDTDAMVAKTRREGAEARNATQGQAG